MGKAMEGALGILGKHSKAGEDFPADSFKSPTLLPVASPVIALTVSPVTSRVTQ